MTRWTFLLGVVGVGVLLGTGAPPAPAHEMTERYIPLGQSPGLSGKYTVLGKIQTINPQDQTITIVGPAGTWTAQVTPRTKIWLDRSSLRLTNLAGTFAELQPGLMVEVKHENHKRAASGPAEWVKVQITTAP